MNSSENEKIEINCICKTKYHVKRTIKAQCPNCGHIWNLDPTLSTSDIKPLTEINYNVEKGIKI